jgi:hypothetical protein
MRASVFVAKVSVRLFPLTVGVLLLGACSGGQDHTGVASMTSGGPTGVASASAGASGDQQQRALEWAKCMRGNGLDVPDPQPGQGLPLPGDPNDPKIQQAIAACKQYQPAPNINADDPAVKQQMADYAKCMREHGVDMQDPGAGLVKLPDMSDPKVAQANQACSPRVTGK